MIAHNLVKNLPECASQNLMHDTNLLYNSGVLGESWIDICTDNEYDCCDDVSFFLVFI